MGWLNKILKGSGHKTSGGQYHGKSVDDRLWNESSSSWVIHLPEFFALYDFLNLLNGYVMLQSNYNSSPRLGNIIKGQTLNKPLIIFIPNCNNQVILELSKKL